MVLPHTYQHAQTSKISGVARKASNTVGQTSLHGKGNSSKESQSSSFNLETIQLVIYNIQRRIR